MRAEFFVGDSERSAHSSAEAQFARARGEHLRRVRPTSCCKWLLPSWRARRRNGVLQAAKTSRPLWRLDEIAVLPYHALQVARDNHGRPMPREQVATLLQRVQGPASAVETPTATEAFDSPPLDAADTTAEWLERIAQAAVLPFRRDDDARGDESGTPAAWSWSWLWWPPHGSRRGGGGGGGGGLHHRHGGGGSAPAREWGVQLQEEGAV